MKLLLSVHDVTPFHLDRLKRADRVLATLGATHVTYLLVPRYHGRSPIEENIEFREWCRAHRPFDAQWFLHGYFHDEATEPAYGPLPPGLRTWFRSRYLTAKEGEFLRLRGNKLQRRLERGYDAFQKCLGLKPQGFVAPAWLFNNDLFPELEALHIRFTEDQSRVYDLQTRRTIDGPVITWASRAFIYKYGSLLAAPLLYRRWRSRPVLRIAVHPFDFDDQMLVASIKKVVAAAISSRTQSFYSDL